MNVVKNHLKHLKSDLPAGLVVFLVALPLCLGIAAASGEIDGERIIPPLAGIVSGIIGGVVISLLSGSQTSVSGPAAGLIVMVLAAVAEFGYAGLLTVTLIAGIFQVVFGLLRFGKLGSLFPFAVVRGMLVAIGLILILKQIPHGLGYDGDFEGDIAFQQLDGRNTLTEIPFALGHMHVGALIVCLVGLAIILLRPKMKWVRDQSWLPGPLLAVLAGIGINQVFVHFVPSLALSGSFLVQLPEEGLAAAVGSLASPDFSLMTSAAVWISGLGIAVVASLETLLCVEALDDTDPLERETPSNRELFAQGAGNIAAGFLGGIPITAVIVRGSANIQSGNKTRMSSFYHGLLLVAAVAFLASFINLIPFAALAAILLHIGYKLAKPEFFVQFAKRGADHWVPFFATVATILLVDLLVGITVGFVLSTLFILVEGMRARGRRESGGYGMRLGPIVPPLSRALLKGAVDKAEGEFRIDATDSDPIDEDTEATLAELTKPSEQSGVRVIVEYKEEDDDKDDDKKEAATSKEVADSATESELADKTEQESVRSTDDTKKEDEDAA